MQQLFKGMLAGFAVLAVAHPASAAPVAYRMTGTVIDGQDFGQIFGGASSLKGLAFTAVETFDPDHAGSSWSTATASGASDQHGGFATVALTIGSTTKAFSGTNTSLSSQAATQFNSEVNNSFDEIGFNILSAQVKADYTADNAIVGLTQAYAGHYTLNTASGSQIVWANFEVNSLSATGAVSAVPLPSSAPLFGVALLGLAAVGYGRRRDKVRVRYVMR